MDDRDAGSVAGVSDEQRARELAEQIADLICEDRIGSVDAILLPLIRDQRRYQWLRGCTTPNRHPYWAICPPPPEAACVSGDDLDAAIDKAREGA
jgi:hypothetical protein